MREKGKGEREDKKEMVGRTQKFRERESKRES